jgi:thioredoxin 1
MKKTTRGLLTFLLIVGLASCKSKYTPVLSSQQGINFSLISLEQAKQKAHAENKPLFVFVHATWCPTCKKMEHEVLVQKQLGDVYNENFINDAIDLDSPEGKLLNQSIQIQATPTLFFFNADGKLIQKLEGFTSATQLLTLAKSRI